MPRRLTILLSKHRTPQPQQEKLEQRLLAELNGWPQVSVAVAPHLYDLTPNGPAIETLQKSDSDLIVLSWLYPRASYWLLDANRVKGRLGLTSSLPKEDYDEPDAQQGKTEAPPRTIWCFDLRTHDRAEPYLTEIAGIVAAAIPLAETAAFAGAKGHVNVIDEATRERWYPVIDYGRCENCLECLNFCLFGVYGLDADNRLVAEQPDACRPGCPACSRVCPAGAIMFPQHHEPGIAGDPKASKHLKLDLSQLFGGGASPTDLAATERQRAMDEKKRLEETAPQADRPADQDNLDRLVDEVDEMDL